LPRLEGHPFPGWLVFGRGNASVYLQQRFFVFPVSSEIKTAGGVQDKWSSLVRTTTARFLANSFCKVFCSGHAKAGSAEVQNQMVEDGVLCPSDLHVSPVVCQEGSPDSLSSLVQYWYTPCARLRATFPQTGPCSGSRHQQVILPVIRALE
jgi:hypothetical protein